MMESVASERAGGGGIFEHPRNYEKANSKTPRARAAH
jgi:hypothetical protein